MSVVRRIQKLDRRDRRNFLKRDFANQVIENLNGIVNAKFIVNTITVDANGKVISNATTEAEVTISDAGITVKIPIVVQQPLSNGAGS